jgi:hypothetical protein
MDAKRIHELRVASTDAVRRALEDGYVRLFKLLDAGVTSLPNITTMVGDGIDIEAGTRVRAVCALTHIKENPKYLVPGFSPRDYAENLVAVAGGGFVREKKTKDGTFITGLSRIAIPYGSKPPFRSFECALTCCISETQVDI